jgi:hypothetical protein
VKGALIAVAGGALLTALGIGMCYWLEVVRDFATGYAAYPYLNQGFMPVFVAGLMLLAGGCVALGFEVPAKVCYRLACFGFFALPVALLIVRYDLLEFSFNWSVLTMVTLAVLFALGLMFGVLGVSRRKFV